MNFVFFGQIDTGVAAPALDGNGYANLTNSGSSGGAWRGGADQYYAIGSWRIAVGGEAHSRSTLGDATGAAFGFSGASLAALTASASYSGTADYTLTASIAQNAGQPLPAGSPLCDIDGRAISNPATPNIGCRQG